MGRRLRTRGRALDGVVLLDKPLGESSNHAVQRIKRMFNARKVGHTGTLDPLATGVLPLCFGEATKFANVGLSADKTYEVVAQLGVTTNTGDANGEVVCERAVPALDEPAVESALKAYRGKIDQVPPMYSSLKWQGQPLYRLARQGIEVEREARTIEIYQNTLVALNGSTLKLKIACSKGTYIRTLVEDLGQDLGCGAHVMSLRRLQAGQFDIKDCVTVETLLEAKQNHSLLDYLKPVSTMVGDWISVKLPMPSAYLVKQGQPVAVPPQSPTHGWVKLLEEHACGELTFLGIGEITGDLVAPRRLIATNH